MALSIYIYIYIHTHAETQTDTPLQMVFRLTPSDLNPESTTLNPKP